MQNKRVGIIGFGAIGRALAKRARGFDMEVLVYTNHKDYEKAEALHVRSVSLQTLLTNADFVVVATAVNARNQGMMDKKYYKQ